MSDQVRDVGHVAIVVDPGQASRFLRESASGRRTPELVDELRDVEVEGLAVIRPFRDFGQGCGPPHGRRSFAANRSSSR